MRPPETKATCATCSTVHEEEDIVVNRQLDYDSINNKHLEMGSIVGSMVFSSSSSLNKVATSKDNNIRSGTSTECPMENNTNSHCSALSTFVMTMFDYHLLSNVYVILFMICSMFMSVAFGAPYTFLPLKCAQDGITKYQTALILSMMGISDIVGKLLSSFLGQKVDFTLLYIISTALFGISMIALSIFETFPTVLAAAICITLGFGK
jgi:predicted neutral ceramidase superfamily lipid hydrolase